MVIDELITLIRFDMPGNSAAVLKKSEGSVSSLTKRVRDLGIVSMATGALTASLGINAVNEANDLQRASEVTGLTTERLQQLESVYKSVGGSAKNAAQDAEAFFRISGGKVMDDDALDVLKSFTSGLTDAEASMKLAGAGFSDDIRRVVGLGEEEFKRRMQYASDFHSLSQQEIDDLNAARAAWVDFGSTADTVSKRIQKAIAPAVMGALSELTGFLNENSDAIAGGVGRVTDRVVELAGIGADAAGEVIDVVKPMWDIFDEAVEKYVGWEDAIAVTVAALAGFSGLATIATVTKGVLGLAGAITGVAAAGSSAALVLGAGGTFVSAIIAANKAMNDFRENTKTGREKTISKAKESDTVEKLEKEEDELFWDNLKRAGTGLYSNGGFGIIADSLSEMVFGNEEINKRLEELKKKEVIDRNFGKSDFLIPDEDYNRLLEIEEILRPKKGLFGQNIVPNNMLSLSLNREKKEILDRASITVQNEININRVRNAEQVAPAVGQAVRSAVQSAFQSNYKLAVPDGSVVNG